MNCVNIKSKEFQELLEATKLPSLLLEMRIAKWQEINGLDNFPTSNEVLVRSGVVELFESNPELANEVYEVLGFNQLITPKDRIVFGHPGIGKTYLRESGRTDVIDFDSDYKTRINEKFNLPEGFKARNDFQKSNKEEYQKAVRELWIEAKQEAKRTGKQLFASDMILLREFANDFDKVITMSKETFVNRAKQRNDYTPGAEGTEGWKQSLDTAISNVDKSKVISTDKYLSDLFITPQQKQQAQQLYSQYLSQNPNGTVEGFKNWVDSRNNQSNSDSLFGLNTQNQERLEFHVNTLNVVSQFLENIGVEQRLVTNFLSQDGNVVEGAIAAANFIEGTVDIIDDLEKGRAEAWNKLPEEAAHWWYRLLDTNSPLKKALWESHQTALKNDKLYAGQYGKLVKSPSDLTEESIGQLIAESIKRIEIKNASASDYSFFKKFLEWINSIIDFFRNTTQDPFEVAAMKILSSDMSDLMTLEEYRKLNNIVNFADVLTEQSVAPIDYTLIEDIGKVEKINEVVGFKDNGQRIVKEKLVWVGKDSRVGGGLTFGKTSPSFFTQQELDNWVSANIKEHDIRQKQLAAEVRDNQIFFDRLLNKTFRKKSRFLPKTLRKYYDIIDSQNLNQLREWNISQELQQITKKLSEQEKKQIIETNGYTNIAPTLKVLPNLLQKYRKNPIVLSETIKIDGAKKQELSILNGIREMIKLENPNLKSITAEEFVNEAHNWLQTNYLLGFANEKSYLSYRTDQTFTNIKDRVSDEDVNLQEFTEAEMMAMPPAERQRIATMMGLTKQNPDVYHNKVSLRFNDSYHSEYGQDANHFAKRPSAWGNLTYFYTGKNKWKDAVLLHEIQNDNIEALRNFKAEKVDLETSLGRYLQQLNEDLLDNITQIESGGKRIQKFDLFSSNPPKQHLQLNYQLQQLVDLPLNHGLQQLKQSLNERIELFKSDTSVRNNVEKAQEAVDGAYSQRRKFQDFQKRGGIKSLLTKEELNDLKEILNRLNTEEVMTDAVFMPEENQYEPGHPTIRNLREKKREFKIQTNNLQVKINSKLKELYGDDAPVIILQAPAKPRTKSQIRQGVQRSQELNENVNFLIAFSEKQISTRLSKNIEAVKKIYISARNATVANSFNVALSKITPEQYATLIENYKYNQDLLNRLIDEQAQKDIKQSSDLQAQKENDLKTISQINPKRKDTPGIKNWIYQINGNVFKAVTKQEAIEDIETYYDKDKKIAKQNKEFEALKQKALDKKAELEKNYGKIEEEVKQTLEIEMNYFTPLVHHLIQKHINQYGKDFPMYFSGYQITKLTQGNDRTALIYAGKDEINIVNKNSFRFNNLAYDIRNSDGAFLKSDYSNQWEGEIKTEVINQQEYEKAYQQATERRAKEIKFEAARQIGFLSNEHNGTNLSDLTDKELDEGIKELNQYKKQSKQNMDRVINTIMNISNSKPIETGAIYNAMSQISGIKLIWQDKIDGLKNNAGGYLVDLTNYNYNVPVLYGLQNNETQENIENIQRQKDRNINLQIDNTNNKVLKKLLQLPTKSNFISNLLDDYNTSSEDTLDITTRKIELMQQGLNAVVLIDTSIEDSGQLLPSNHPISKQYDKPVILINPDKLFSDTVFHEFGHLYIDLLGIEDPLVKQAIELLKDSELFEEIKSKYPELSEEDLNKEVLATALGLTVDKVFKRDIENMSLWGKIKNAILTAISKLLGLNNNSLEKLAKEMLSGKTRLTGAESFNSLITQRSKFKLDKSNPNKQQATLDVFKSMSKRVNKVEDLNDRFYEDTETEEIYRDSVTTYKKKFLSNTQRNRGDFDIIFDASEYTRDNIEEHLNNNKISAPLAKALDNYVNNRLPISSPFQLNEGEYFWNQVHDRIILETDSPIDTWKQEARASTGIDNDFIYNVKNDLAYILEEAEKIKKLWEQAPIAGTIVHKIVEDYINEEISEFPNNINDSDDKLLNAIKNIIDTGKKNGSVFLTEQILLSESKGIPGTADIIEVLKDGTVRIYDFKTIRNLNKNNKPKTDIDLVKYPGYGHQLVIYGAIINESGIELTQENPYNILFAEIKYSGEVDPNSEIEITDTKLIDLSNKYYLSELLRVQREVLRDFASSDLLEELNLKSDIEDLNDLTNEIFQALRTFEVLTKNMRTTLDTSHIRKLYEDLKKENAGTIDEYVSKDNEVAIKSFIETIYNSLSILELQKPQLGDIVASDFLNNLEYVLQAADKLQDVKAFLLENPNVLVDNKQVILNTINRTIELINSNKDYYKEKLKVGSINILAQNSNLMEGVHREVYELELKAQNPEAWKKLSRDEKNKKINDKLEANKSVLKFKEYQFWKNQYENGILDIRTLEKYMADPSMNKSQIVQIVKNIMDKMDNRVRSEMMNIVPEIVDWYDTLKYDKNKSPKERWSHLFVDETYIDIYGKKQKVKTRRIIQDTTSDYLDVILKYQYQDNYYNKEISRLTNSKTKLTPEQDKLLLELKNKLEKLREDKYVELSNLSKTKGDLQYKQRSNPEYDKLSKQDKEFLEEVKKHLNEADERLYDTPDKKLTKSYKDGNKVFYIPAYRMTDAEAIKSGKFIDRNMSKLRDMVKPPADEDELGITDLEYENKPSLDIANNEYYTIPIFYRNDLEDPSLQSFDIPSLLVMNHETTLHYREAKAIDADLFVILNSVSSKNNNKIKKTDNFLNKDTRSKLGNKIQQSEDNNLFTAVKSSIDNRLYKRSYVGSFTSGANYKFIKAVDTMGEYSRILALMGNFKSALTTGMQGTAYRFIEGLVGENFSMEDYKKGTTKTYGDLVNLISDTQKYAPTSKTNLLIKKFGLENQLQSLTNKFVQDNFAYKNLDKNTLYSVTSIAETLVTAQLMYSITNSIKALDADGDYIDINGNKTTKDKAITIDEAYTVEKGRLVLNKNVVYTTNNINSKYFTPIEKDVTFASTELSSKIRSIYADLYGQYNQSLKSHVQRTVIGRQLMSLRNWLPRGLHRRWRGFSDVIGKNFMDFEELRDLENFDKRFYTQDQKRFQEGHYVTSIRLFRSILKDMKENQMSLASYFNIRKKLINNQLTDHEIANLKRTQIELALVALTMILAMALRAMAKSYEGDDEDKEKIYMTAYLSYRLNDEISTFINPLAMAKMLANPAVGLSTIERIGKFGNQLIGISYSDEDGWTPNAFEIYERGPKEGYNKAYIKGMNLVPGYVNAQQLLSIIGSEGTHKIEDVYKNIERN